MSTPTIITLFLLLSLAGIVAFNPGLIGLTTTKGGGGSGSGGGITCLNGFTFPSIYQCVNAATLTFALNDPLAKAAVATATLTVYNPDGSSAFGDSGSTSSSGQWTTNGKYGTGQKLIVSIVKSTYITVYQALTVPPAQASATSPTNIQIPIFTTLLGAWTNTVTGNPGGSAIAHNDPYFFNSQASPVTSLQISWTLSESTNNAGFIPSYDVWNGLTQNLVMQADDGGSGTTTVSGFQYEGKSGTTTYDFWTIPSGVTINTGQDGVTLSGVTIAPSGATQKYDSLSQTSTGGSYTWSFNVKIGSLTAGGSMTETFKLYYNASPLYWLYGKGENTGGAQQSSLGPNAAQSGSNFAIVFKY